jgi:dienelactone hydrolase
MKYFLIINLLLLPVLFTGCSGQERNTREYESARRATWEKIEPYFSVPEEFKDQYGEYRSPLKFYNGQPVNTKEDWAERRKEILNRWHEMMGEWPPLMEDQELEILWKSTRSDGYSEYRIAFYWAPDQKTEGYLLIPDGEEVMPAVVTVNYDSESAIGFGPATSNRDFAYQLTKRGFVTLSIGSPVPYRRDVSIYYPDRENAKVEPLSMLAYAAANAWHVLSKVPEVDPARIGITGHSYGGKWAMFASGLFDKFACAAWSDGGIVFDESRGNVNYWEAWYLGYHPPPWRRSGIPTAQNPARGTYSKLVEEGYDLHELHALMAPRPFLVSGGSEDPPERWIPLNHTVAVNRLLGFENRVGMTNRPEHSLNPEATEQIYQFFEYFLKYNGINE